MTSNKHVRQELEILYGKGCMFRRAGIEQKVEQLKTIKTFKTFIAQKRFTRKQINKYGSILTVHHLKHRSEGGETSVRNGAEICNLAHLYLHSLPREHEEIINNMLREWKAEHYMGCEVVLSDDYELPFDIETLEITPTNEELQVKKFNRAKEKSETRKIIDRYYNEMLDDEERLD